VITYVDTSTLIKLIIDEPGSDIAEDIWTSADALVSVGLVEVEARAALGAATRAGRLTKAEHRRTVKILGELLDQMDVVDVTAELIGAACQLTDLHGLRGYDAVHLAAARAVGSDVLTSADNDLCDAAEREGIHSANPLSRR
jgi:predicted nucleic acid-binding protein